MQGRDMSGAVTLHTENLPSAEVSPLSGSARAYASAAAAENTKRAYRAAWADFTSWCEAEGLEALPAAPETVGNFLTARAGTHKAASLNMRLVAIGQAHRLKGHALDTRHPAIRETMKGIRRTHGTAPAKKAAVVVDLLRDAMAELAKIAGPRALRDRAMLLVGFAAALRRSELVAIDAEDVQAGRGWHRHHSAAPQDRPGGPRDRDRHPLRPVGAHLPSPYPPGLAGSLWHHHRPAVRLSVPAWRDWPDQALPERRSPGGKGGHGRGRL